SRDERKAMFAAVFVVLSITFGPLALSYVLALSFPRTFSEPTAVWPILALSPAYAPSCLLASFFFPLPRGSFWWSVLQVNLLSWCMLLLAGRILPRLCQARGSDPALERQRERVEQWAYGRAEARKTHRARLLGINPFLWLATREILRGQWLAFRRQFAKPLGVILLFEFLLLRQPFATQLVLINLLMLVADVLTLGWVGMWLGLTARSLNRAILGTIGRVLLLPWGAYYTAMFALEVLERLSGRGPLQH